MRRRAATGEHVYTDFRYQAGTWSYERRIVCKAEVVRLEGREPRLNARFVVTNLPGKPQRIYERIYCQRGEVENRIKELFDVALDRPRCSRCPTWSSRRTWAIPPSRRSAVPGSKRRRS